MDTTPPEPASTPAAAPASPPALPAQGRDGFRPEFEPWNWWNWRNWLLGVAFLITLITGVVFAYTAKRPDDPAESVGFVIGSFLGPFVCVGVVPLVLFLCARVGRDGKRSSALHTAAAVTAICLAFLMAGSLALAAARAARFTAEQRSQAARQAMDEAKRVQAEMEQKRLTGEYSEKDLDRVLATNDKMASTLSGSDKPLGEMTLQFNGYVAEALRPLVRAQDEFASAGGLDVVSPPNKESLAKRAELARKIQPLAAAALELTKSLDKKLDELAAANGVAAEPKAGFRRGMLANGRHEKLIRLRELDVEIYRLAESYFTILHDSFGQWKMADDLIEFDNDEALAAFNAVADPLHAKADEQLRLIEEMRVYKSQKPAEK